MLDVKFGKTGLKAEECESNTKTNFDIVSICTEHNLTDYKLAPPRKRGVQFVLVVITSMRESHDTGALEPGAATASAASAHKMFMVERIQTIEPTDIEQCQQMLAKLAYARSEFSFGGLKRSQDASQIDPMTPLADAKKTRRLSASPTDASLPDERK